MGPENNPAGIANAVSAADAGQAIIRDYGKDLYGEAMYNNAEYARQFVH